MSPPGLKEACKYAESIYRTTRKVRVTQRRRHRPRLFVRRVSGDDAVGLRRRARAISTIGARGHIHTFPNEGSTEGTVVFQPGDIVILPYCRYVTDPVKLTIREGHVVDIDGGLDAKLMRDWLADGKCERGRPRSLRRFASRLGHESAGALVRHRA